MSAPTERRRREYIKHARGVYIARKQPYADWIIGDWRYVIVMFTHDFGRAAELAWELIGDEVAGLGVDIPPLPQPRLVWVRRAPVLPSDWEAEHLGLGWRLLYAKPGSPGVSPAVEFPPADWWSA